MDRASERAALRRGRRGAVPPSLPARVTPAELLEMFDGRLQRMGGVLRCKKDKTHQIPLGDVESYRRTGWPVCCEQTMTMVTAAELAEEERRLRRRRERYK